MIIEEIGPTLKYVDNPRTPCEECNRTHLKDRISTESFKIPDGPKILSVTQSSVISIGSSSAFISSSGSTILGMDGDSVGEREGCRFMGTDGTGSTGWISEF